MDNTPEALTDKAAPDQLKHTRSRRIRGCFPYLLIGITIACFLLAGLSFLSNLILPAHQGATEQLSELDKARLDEAFHLRSELGDKLWPGWGQADIPMILYNENYAFLVDYPNPPPGWKKVPGNEIRGGAWEAVPDDTFVGQTYYRQRLAEPSVTPEAFTVQIGDRWVSSLGSREWMEISLGNYFKENIPSIIQPFFPYRLAGRVFLSAAGGKDWYILGLLHESFHAFEGMSDPDRLAAAETTFYEHEDRYMWDDDQFRQDWQEEMDLLSEAVHADSYAETLELARRFLAHRQERRRSAHLDADLSALESLKEWEEGLAKYTELSLWRLAASTSGYHPSNAMSIEPGFRSYAGAEQRWSQEIRQIRRMANDDGDSRFYYSGLAQAAILDRLMPEWKKQIMTGNMSLEELLKEAVQ